VRAARICSKSEMGKSGAGKWPPATDHQLPSASEVQFPHACVRALCGCSVVLCPESSFSLCVADWQGGADGCGVGADYRSENGQVG